MKKPKFCNQNYLEMKPTEGGRICEACNKKILDFTKLSMKEIESINNSGTDKVCGLYTGKQLRNWGKESRSSFKPILAATAILLSMNKLTAQSAKENMLGQTKVITQNTTDSLKKESTSKQKEFFNPLSIQGRITDENGDEIPLANVFIKNSNHGTSADLEGYFELQKIENNRKDTLEFSAISYSDLELPLDSIRCDYYYEINPVLKTCPFNDLDSKNPSPKQTRKQPREDIIEGVQWKLSSKKEDQVVFTISGQIKNEFGEELPMANVRLKSNLDYSTSADIKGNYSFDMDVDNSNQIPDDSLVFSYIGYKDLIVPLNSCSIFMKFKEDIQLVELENFGTEIFGVKRANFFKRVWWRVKHFFKRNK